MPANKLLGGSQVQLSRFDKLTTPSLLGNVHAPGGGFSKSPIAGGLVKTLSQLRIDATLLGTPEEPAPLSDSVIVKTQVPVTTSVVVTQAAVVTTPDTGVGGGGVGDDGGGGGGGDGGE